VLVEGSRQGERLVASSVRVVSSEPGSPVPGDGGLVGEIISRSEQVMVVQLSGEGVAVTVEVPDEATVVIPSIPGTNNVSQLRHRLDVQRMSKSRGNTANPDELVEEFGADTVRTYLMFAFEWEKGGPWDSRGIRGARRFIMDVWRLGKAEYRSVQVDATASTALRRRAHQAIIKVGGDLEGFRWNTAVAELMKLRNSLNAALADRNVDPGSWKEALSILVLLLAPVAPHVTEEVWHRLGNETSVHLQSWPVADEEVAAEEVVTMVVQVNGRLRARIEVPVGISEATAVALAIATPNVQRFVAGAPIRRVIDRRPNLINLVV